jgi:CRISPR-associated protein Cas4
VYSETYWICWKIDIFNTKTWELTERKNLVKRENDKEKIYLWYKLQLWWQMFCLEEMWHEVQSLWIYSMSDNRKYRIYKPSSIELLKFQELLEKYKEFNPNQKWWTQNTQKCIRCIYRELCDYYIWEVYPQLKIFE